jgi:hypothetical protein
MQLLEPVAVAVVPVVLVVVMVEQVVLVSVLLGMWYNI